MPPPSSIANSQRFESDEHSQLNSEVTDFIPGILHPDRYRMARNIWTQLGGNVSGHDEGRIYTLNDLAKDAGNDDSDEDTDLETNTSGTPVYVRDQKNLMLKVLFHEFIFNMPGGMYIPYEPGDIDVETAKLAKDKRGRHSTTWQFFRIVAVIATGEAKAQCILCKLLFKMQPTSGTSSLNKHIKNKKHLKKGRQLIKSSTYEAEKVLEALEGKGLVGTSVIRF